MDENSRNVGMSLDEKLDLIMINDQRILKLLYKENYLRVEIMVLKNSGSKEKAKDLYQESFLAMWKNIKLGKFKKSKTASINGYLYQIAKNKWIDFLRSTDYKLTDYPDQILQQEYDHDLVQTDDEIEEKLNAIEQSFTQIGESCKKLLQLFYYRKCSMNEIAEMMSIDSASARNKKYRCMNKLRHLSLKHIKK